MELYIVIRRERKSEHFMIDVTFHHPQNYSQLLIIMFKDLIISEILPCFYVLMSKKTEILYDLIFKAILSILTQNDNYNLNIKTIISDCEIALIKAFNNNFKNIQRINCFYHYKMDLIKEAKTIKFKK